MMAVQHDECRWCGDPHVYQMGLCYICYQERMCAHKNERNNESLRVRDIIGMVREITNRRIRGRIVVVD